MRAEADRWTTTGLALAGLALVAASCGATGEGAVPAPAPTPSAEGSAAGPLTAGEQGTEAGTGRGAAGAFDPAALLGSRPGPGVPFGLAAPAADVRAVEDRAGERLGVVRVFARWDTVFPSADQQALLDEGRVLHLSVRPRTDAGEDIAWNDLATAEPGTPVHDQLDRWTRTVAAFGPQIYFTLNHEPETDASAGHGTPAEYRAAWRRTVELLRANGGDRVRTVLVLGRGAYADGEVDRWYPGDDVVDVVGVDAYNWYDCQGGPVRPWTMPAELLAPAVAFARLHDKPLAIPEIASTEHPDDPLAKATWILELARTLAGTDLAVTVDFAAWFSVDDRSWPDCRWRRDSSPASVHALDAVVAWLNRPA